MEELDTKEKILKGATELFMRYGIRSISMDDIARQLGVSKKTLYQHFADKDELVMLVSRNHLDQHKRQFDAIRDDSKNPIEELAKLSQCIRADMETMNPSVLFDLQKFHPKAWSEWQAFKSNYMRQSIVRNLKLGMAEGFIRPEINPEIMAAIRIEMVQIPFNTEVLPPTQFNLAEVQEHLFDHFVYGLVTDKGRKLYEKYKTKNPQSQPVL
ncbi:MAG: TetR/AcrR family transcriptional regulator [Cyclobacteriaceae bacterium]|nr:TetR/AcrR family transcriptional regulator [Cyclobacteriaceae bacterium]